MATSLKALMDSLVVKGAFSNLALVDLDTNHAHIVFFTPGALSEELSVLYMLDHNVLTMSNIDLFTNTGVRETKEQFMSIINYSNEAKCIATVSKGRMIKIGYKHSDKPLDMTFKLKEYYKIASKTPMYNKEKRESYIAPLPNRAIDNLKRDLRAKDPGKWVVEVLKYTFPEDRDKVPPVDLGIARVPKVFSHDTPRASDLWESIATGSIY